MSLPELWTVAKIAAAMLVAVIATAGLWECLHAADDDGDDSPTACVA